MKEAGRSNRRAQRIASGLTDRRTRAADDVSNVTLAPRQHGDGVPRVRYPKSDGGVGIGVPRRRVGTHREESAKNRDDWVAYGEEQPVHRETKAAHRDEHAQHQEEWAVHREAWA
jgi:hypothetical protein